MAKDTIYCEINDKEIIEIFYKFLNKISDKQKVMRAISRIMLNDVEENFKTQGVNNTGEKWQDWDELYRAYREKIGRGSGDILTLEGELKKGISRKATESEAIVYSDKIYSAIHNFGGDIRRGGKIVG